MTLQVYLNFISIGMLLTYQSSPLKNIEISFERE